jgi:predicted O-linked N-acetylglucosamine transferase (SPINDLY family)
MARPPNISNHKLPLINNPIGQQAQPVQSQKLIAQGLTLYQQGKIEPAFEIFKKIISIEPTNFEALHIMGVILIGVNQHQMAIDFLKRAIKVNSKNSDAFYNLGLAYDSFNQKNNAIESYQKAVLINSRNYKAYNNKSKSERELGLYDIAIVSAEAAIRIKPDYLEAHYNHGIALQELGRHDEALASYNTAIRIKADYAEAYNNRGIALQQLGRPDEALASFNKAISIKPDYAEALNNRGIALNEWERPNEAIASYDKAISIKADYADAHYNRGIALKTLKRFDEAVASYDRALQHKPNLDYLIGELQHTKMFICDWTDFDHQNDIIVQQIIGRQKSSLPFIALALTDNPKTHQLCTQTYVQDKYPSKQSLGPITKHLKQDKIRVGYFSADFRNHAVSYLTAQLFETHDKEKFETIAFSFGPNKPDEMQARLAQSFDQFIDVHKQSSEAVAQLARSMGIDIAVDLGGFTANSPTGVFAYRAAPIQLSYIGYLGTMSAEYFDYLIADRTIIPTHLQQYYCEKIVYLPSYQVNDNKRVIADKPFTRQELGLPDTGFVFCCFNNNYKITPTTFDGWMRILKAVKGSVLFLYAEYGQEANLKKEAEKSGVDAQRLVFGKRIVREEYLARYQACDLFLDTLPYNAGTTASDALWAGLPVLTLMGESFASRVAASLLTAIELPELITATQPEYEALAIELATNPQKLAAIKQKLSDHRLTTPLFNTPLFTKHLETAYTHMMERYWSDLPPEHLYI